jgi:hypothetical protein
MPTESRQTIQRRPPSSQADIDNLRINQLDKPNHHAAFHLNA